MWYAIIHSIPLNPLNGDSLKSPNPRYTVYNHGFKALSALYNDFVHHVLIVGHYSEYNVSQT